MGTEHAKSATATAKASASASIEVGTELWLAWADIAIEQADIARVGRAAIALALRNGEQPEMNAELHPAMIATAAAATSLDGFATVLKSCGVAIAKPAKKGRGSSGRAQWIWETLRAGFTVSSKTNTWPQEIEDLFKLRDGQLHPRTLFGAPVQHPLVDGVTQARKMYTTEAADNAVRLMREIYKTCSISVQVAFPSLVSRMRGLDKSLRRIAP
jgi:hypothetical protein